MRYLRIFSIYSQHTLQYRSTNVVWFLISLYQPLLLLLFWRVAYQEHGEVLTGWSLSSVAAYYLFLMAASAFLMVHVEEDAYEDMQRGDLSMYLMKPFSYFWMKFMGELPWRLLQGLYGIIAITLLSLVFGIVFTISHSVHAVVLFLAITVLGYFVSFTFKMLLLLAAFWLTDTSALRNLTELVLLIGAGFIVPLQYLPEPIRQITMISPFASMLYYPLMAIVWPLSGMEYVRIIGMQILWILIFLFFYRRMWINGVKKFCAVGR